MDVYKIVVTVIALVIVTLLSVIAEMLGKAQEERRACPADRHKKTPDARKGARMNEAIASNVSQTRVDGQQNPESQQAEVRKQRGASSEQDG